MTSEVFRRHAKDWEVDERGADAVKHALGEEQLPDLRAEACESQPEAHEEDAGNAENFRAFYVEPGEDGVDEERAGPGEA